MNKWAESIWMFYDGLKEPDVRHCDDVLSVWVVPVIGDYAEQSALAGHAPFLVHQRGG